MIYKKLSEAKPNISDIYRASVAYIMRGGHPAPQCGRATDGFVYCLLGGACYDFGDYKLNVKEGDIIFLARGCRYSIFVNTDKYIARFVNFDFILPDNVRLYSTSMYPPNGRKAEDEFQKLLSTWYMQDDTSKQKCMSILYSIYTNFLRDYSTVAYRSPEKRRRMETALMYIEANMRRPELSVPEIARSVGLSETHFRRTFKEIYNISPAKYINVVRIKWAKQKVRFSEESFTDIAEEFGFQSIYYFSYIFKKELNCTPSEYRKRQKFDCEL